MCQITVGSCHSDAIQTEDACHSCTDGGIVSLLKAISTDCFLDIYFRLITTNVTVLSYWSQVPTFLVSMSGCFCPFFIILKHFGRRKKTQYKLDYKWVGPSVTAHVYYCFFIPPAAAEAHESMNLQSANCSVWAQTYGLFMTCCLFYL